MLNSTFNIQHLKYLMLPVICLMLSCSFKKEIPPPPGTIGKDTMQRILTDLSLSESILNNGTIKDTLSIDILSKYYISRQRYDSSFTYYTQSPTELKEIYTQVLENLNSRK
ncbi:MAG: DUF4296 domain-containing protein [Bacteroidia bacterium]